MPLVIAAVAVLPAVTLMLVGFTFNGAVTVTETVLLLPLLSFTVTVVVPVETPVMANVAPLTDAVATWAFAVEAEYGTCPPEIAPVPVLPAATVIVVGVTVKAVGCKYAIVVEPNPDAPVTSEYAILK